MLDANLTAQLKAYLEKVTQPFEIVASLDGSAKSTELQNLLEEIAGMSDKITLRTDGDDARKPSFSLNRINGEISLRFAGIPDGARVHFIGVGAAASWRTPFEARPGSD